MATLIITGAAGKIGTAIRGRLTDHALRLTDIRELPEPLRPNESYLQSPLSDQAALTEFARGADVMVHLGGLLVDHGFAETADVNILGTYQVLQATQSAGVKRFFYASSNHAVGYTPVADVHPEEPVSRMEIRPDGYYGVSKAAAEALCSLFADEYGMSILSGRILTFAARPRSLRELATWISPDDTVRLVLATLTLEGPGHRVCWGVSRNTRRWASLRDGEALGFYPVDDSEPWAESILAEATDEDQQRTIAIGGRSAPHPRTTDHEQAGAHR